MFHRIYIRPNTCINEAWNFNQKFDSLPSPAYRDTIIRGQSNDQIQTQSLFCDFYKYFAIDIVTETVFNYPYAQITEKTIRPIVHKKMFIIVGSPGTLSMLQDKGFKTFAPFINEEYDTIQDPHNRMQFIANELTRISKFSIDSIQKTMLLYRDTIEHNYKHYHWLHKNEIIQLVDRIDSNTHKQKDTV